MFRFALDPLLRHRRLAEDALRARYAVAARAERCGVEAQRELGAALAGACTGVKRASDLMEIEAALRAQAARIERSRVACARLREALVDAARTRRALEILRERRLQAYRCERRRRDERELDEAARGGERSNAVGPSAVLPSGARRA